MNLKNNISKLLGLLIIILALTFSTSSYAKGKDGKSKQTHGDDSSGSTGSTSVPLDGGLSVLLLGAAAFGVKKLRDNKK